MNKVVDQAQVDDAVRGFSSFLKLNLLLGKLGIKACYNIPDLSTLLTYIERQGKCGDAKKVE